MSGPLESMRSRLRRSRSWTTLRRIQREGPLNAWKRWRMWSRILDTAPVVTAPIGPQSRAEVHLLCSYRDYLCGIWALKSFYHFAGVSYPLVIHIQGGIADRALSRLRRHFPNARLVRQAEADGIVEEYLSSRGLTRLLNARRTSPFMMKLTDFPILSESEYMLTLDSDVLFFSRPSELLSWPGSATAQALFQRDVASAYNISEAEAEANFGIRMAKAVNTGIALLLRRNLDLSRCEQFLAHPEVAKPTGFIEQTLHSLCASEVGEVAYLPESYLVCLEPVAGVDGLVARHYAGTSRRLLTAEGMPALLRKWAQETNG